MPEFVSADELVEATGRDPIAIAMVEGDRVVDGAWSDDGAFVWRIKHRDAPAFIGIGPPRRAARIVESLVEQEPGAQRHASLPRGWLDHVGAGIRTERKPDWDWFWTTSAPQPISHEGGATWLKPDDEADIATVLSDAMPGASAQPGDERVRRWAGIRDSDGRLVACLADTSRSDRVVHLASVATATSAQGNGYGAALVSWVTREMLSEGAGMVTLGMYSDNAKARRLYERLGFECRHGFSAAAIAHTPAPGHRKPTVYGAGGVPSITELGR